MGHSVPGRPPQSSSKVAIRNSPTLICSPVSISTTSTSVLTSTGQSSDNSVRISIPVADGSVRARATSIPTTPATVQRQVVATVPGVHGQGAAGRDGSGPRIQKPAAVQLEPVFPFADEGECGFVPTVPPAKPLVKPSSLKDAYFYISGSKSCTEDDNKHVFIDKKLPACAVTIEENKKFGIDYFVTLHKLTSAPGPHYPAGTPYHKGARIPLRHTKLRLDRWRHHLLGYEGVELCQFLEFGFPIGLPEGSLPKLSSTMRNHGSSIQFYSHIDKFLNTGLELGDVVGPCSATPFTTVHISPLMTAPKKPGSRRAVFDATVGDFSLNNGTPCDEYLGQPISFTYPKIEDFKHLVLNMGKGCYIFKRDLSRYFLQMPLDPIEYNRVAFVWRSFLFFFTGFMFGLRHAGLQGQRLTTAISWRHQRMGLETDKEEMYHSINYSDDIGGCERTYDRALDSFNALADLFEDLGMAESTNKAHEPSTSMPYLGVNFNTISMKMSIPAEKLTEVRDEISFWSKKTKATKKGLQQLLGKLFWVSRCVKFSRIFMARLLTQLSSMHMLADHTKVSFPEECRLDIQWWSRYLRRFNGVECMYPDEPMDLSLDQLLDTTAFVNCGDAQPMGGGAYFGSQYWSQPFPLWLQDPNIGIHVKEFWVVLVSAWLWGESWRGQVVYVFCDNVAVVETLEKQKPKDSKLQELLREYLYVVCTRGFTPKFRVVGTKANLVADFISRRHDPEATVSFFTKNNHPQRSLVHIPETYFKLQSNW